MVLDTEKQVDESIASLLKQCAESDEEGLGGVLKVVTALAEFMDMDNTMKVLNGLLYHDNEKIALNSFAIFRHLHETGYINLQPIALSRIEDGEELVEPIDEEEMSPKEGTLEESDETTEEPIPAMDILEESVMPICMKNGVEEFELQVPEISTFIPVGETGEEEIPEIEMDNLPFDNAGESPFAAAEEPAPLGEIGFESPFEYIEKPTNIGDIASPFDGMGEEPPSPFNERFEPESEGKKVKLSSISAIEGEAKEQWGETVDKITKLKEKYINK